MTENHTFEVAGVQPMSVEERLEQNRQQQVAAADKVAAGGDDFSLPIDDDYD